MKKIALCFALMFASLQMFSQKYVDSESFIWTVAKPTGCVVSADYWGLKISKDSLDIQICPSYTGFVDFSVTNNRSRRVSLIWDETTLNSENIVFGDMLKIQIGNSIRPSFIDPNGFIKKQITTEDAANNSRPFIDYKFDKKQSKKSKIDWTEFIDLTLVVEDNAQKQTIQISLEGKYYRKEYSREDRQQMNDTQNFE